MTAKSLPAAAGQRDIEHSDSPRKAIAFWLLSAVAADLITFAISAGVAVLVVLR
jgi:hypothetical protein